VQTIFDVSKDSEEVKFLSVKMLFVQMKYGLGDDKIVNAELVQIGRVETEMIICRRRMRTPCEMKVILYKTQNRNKESTAHQQAPTQP
jgi:hypothetical protein